MTEKQENKGDPVVQIELEGAIEKKSFDIEPYIGKKSKIVELETRKSKQWDDNYYLLVKTDIVAYADEEKKKPVQASRIFRLLVGDGHQGWAKDGDLDLFLRSKNVAHPNDLIGVEVTIIPTKPNKDGVRYLTF